MIAPSFFFYFVAIGKGYLIFSEGLHQFYTYLIFYLYLHEQLRKRKGETDAEHRRRLREWDEVRGGGGPDDEAEDKDSKENAEPEDPFADNPFNVDDVAAADGIAFTREAPNINGFFIFPAARAAMRAIGKWLLNIN